MELSQERSNKRPLNPPKAGQRKKPSTAEAMKKGAEIPVSNLDRKEPAPGDNATNAFITWSAPRTGGRWRKPASVTRKEFAVILGQCWGEILDIVAADPGNEEDPPAPEIAVFKESRKDGGTHYHAILDAPRTTLWRRLPVLLRDPRLACDVKIGAGAGVKHSGNMLRYCMVPTADKYDVGPTPFFSPGFRVPPYVLNEARVAQSRLSKRPADAEEVKRFLFQNPNIKTWENLTAFVDKAAASSPDSINLLRLSQFLSKHGGKDGKSTVKALVDGRDAIHFSPENEKKYRCHKLPPAQKRSGAEAAEKEQPSFPKKSLLMNPPGRRKTARRLSEAQLTPVA